MFAILTTAAAYSLNVHENLLKWMLFIAPFYREN